MTSWLIFFQICSYIMPVSKLLEQNDVGFLTGLHLEKKCQFLKQLQGYILPIKVLYICVCVYFSPSNVHAAHATGVHMGRSVKLSLLAGPRHEILWFSPTRSGCDAPSRAVLTAGITEQLHQFHGTWICEL